MSRSRSLSRAAAVALAGVAAATLLTGCFGTPTVVSTPSSAPTGFDEIGGGGDIDTGNTVDPTEAPTEGYSSLVDDLGVLSLQVPAAWTDVDGAPFTTDGGTQWASLVASTNIDDYFGTFDVSGVEFAGTTLPDGLTDDDLKTFLDSATGFLLEGCDVLEQGTAYDDGFYVGYQSGFENCGGVGTEGFGVVAVDNAGTHIVYVIAQIAGSDDPSTVYTAITGSFQASISRAG